MKPIREKRNSILHVQNVFLSHPISIYLARETPKYFVGYELKQYRIHHLLYKLSKDLLGKVENPINVSRAVDINVREDFRWFIKRTDPNSRIEGKTIIVRIVPTRYHDISPLYATIFSFRWRKTEMGGVDEIKYEIPECPIISNSNSVHNVCYKRIGFQRSFYGTHGTYTYVVLAPEKGRYRIGEWIKISNVSKSGRQYKYSDPITVDL